MEWWLVTFRLWRCLILKSVQPKETYNTPLLSGLIPALVLCNQLTKDEADSRGLYNKRKLCAWYFEYKWQKCTWQKGLLCRRRVLRTTCWCERSVKSSLHNSCKCQQADYFVITLSERRKLKVRIETKLWQTDKHRQTDRQRNRQTVRLQLSPDGMRTSVTLGTCVCGGGGEKANGGL